MICLEIVKFEILSRIKRLETYVFFAVLFFFSLIAFNFIFEGQSIGTSSENSPFIIAKLMAIISGIFMVITSLVMGVPVLRDFELNMESIIFVQPISKKDYLFGRFIGSFVVLVLIFSALIWGLIIGEYMPWRNSENLLSFDFWAYLHPFLTIVLPTLFFGSALFFVSGTLSRNMIVVYTQGVLFFIFFVLSNKIENQFISALVDPFTYRAIGEIVDLWSDSARNTKILPLSGVLLYNRLMWSGIGILSLVIGYFSFDFIVVQKSLLRKTNNSLRLKKKNGKALQLIPNHEVQIGIKKSLRQLWEHSVFYFKSIFNEVSFWSIVICAAIIIIINSVSLGGLYGVDSLPKTYLMVEELQESSIFFFLIVLVFYSGELIWQERKVGVSQIFDALPISDLMSLSAKFFGLLMIYIILLVALVICGVVYQTSVGYFNYEMEIYFMGFFVEIFSFLVLYTFFSFFIQIISNSKFVGYILVLVFFLATLAMSVLDFGHVLFRFGGVPLGQYSEMNGHGHHLLPFFSFQLYWFAFCILLFVVSTLLLVRGQDVTLKSRWNKTRYRFTKPVLTLGAVALVVFSISGAYIFYNTNVLNNYLSSNAKNQFRAEYEKTLRQFATLPQPKLVQVKLNAELYPTKRDYFIDGVYQFVNDTDQPLQTLFVQKWVNDQVKLEKVTFMGGATVDSTFARFEYLGYILNEPLNPGDTIEMSFRQSFITQGFVAQNSSIRVAHNGMFIDNHILPMLGYNHKFELRDDEVRSDFGLDNREGLAKRTDSIIQNKKTYGVDEYEVLLEIVVGTELDQYAVAPGELLKEWEELDRRYFHYKMNSPMMNLYSINSGKYNIITDQWTPSDNKYSSDSVRLSIFYHPGHETNLDRMMSAMKASLEYYTKEFSPFQYDQMSIVEFPRYIEFAQSFPNMIPFSEALGFILDIDDEEDVDVAFFVTAHEMAHQWWGHQVTASDVQGWPMVIESLAQYSALMVLQQHFSEDIVRQFVQAEMERYLAGRLQDNHAEVAMEVVEHQEYIYYRKGLVNLYALQNYISEEKVNLALRKFIRDWNVVDGLCQDERYPTSADLVQYFRAETPDSLQYVITDLFESVIIYDSKVENVRIETNTKCNYNATINLDIKKLEIDSLGKEMILEDNDWIDIGVYSYDRSGKDSLIHLDRHRITYPLQELTICLEKNPIKVVIDPHCLMIDKNIKDNTFLVAD